MRDDREQRIESKLDKVVDHIGSIDITIARLTVSVEDHVRRTELLEQTVVPLKAHDNMRAGAAKFIVFILGVCAAIEGVVVLLQYLRR